MSPGRKTVASFNKPEDAYLAAGYLESEGIECTVRDEHTVAVDWLYAQAIGGVKVDVSHEDYARAAALLKVSKESAGFFACPHCGSSKVRLRELSGIVAVSMLALGFILPIASRKADCLDCRRSFRVKEDDLYPR